MRNFWAILLATLLQTPVLGDIAPEPLSGGATISRRASNQPTKVAMVHETVRISVSDEAPEFHITFCMKNTGDHPESIQVGFPFNYKDELIDFRAAVDGKPVLVDSPVDRFSYEHASTAQEVVRNTYWKLWPMTFPPGKEITVDVWYTSKTARRLENVMFSRANLWSMLALADAAQSVLPADEFDALKPRLKMNAFRYVLRSGAGWHGPIGRCRVEVDLTRVVTGGPAPHFGSVPNGSFTFLTPDLAIWEVENLEPWFDLYFAMLPDSTIKEVEQIQTDLSRRFPDSPLVADVCARFERQNGRFAAADAIERRLFEDWQNRIAMWGPDVSIATIHDSQRVWEMVSRTTWKDSGVNEAQPRPLRHRSVNELIPIVRTMVQRLDAQARSFGRESHSAANLIYNDLPAARRWCDDNESFFHRRAVLTCFVVLAAMICAIAILHARRRHHVKARSTLIE